VTERDRVRLARVALALLVEPGHRDLGLLVRDRGPVGALDRLCAGDGPPALAAAVSARHGGTDPYEQAVAALVRAEGLGARLITPEDGEYPGQLAQLAFISEPAGADTIRRDRFPPQCIWARGPLALAGACERSVAVVGARASTAYGDYAARTLAYDLAEAGWTVISGGAYGIDAAAHRGALAAGGPTVAVLACGIDRAYPASHAPLFDRIGQDGLLISEWPPGSDPHKRRFLIRNRVIAALARGTVMVEAHLRSGARYTLNRARDLNRVVLAVPGPVTSGASAGCHEAIREGATLVTGAADVIEAVSPIGATLPAEVDRAAGLSSLQAQVLDGVRPRKIRTAGEVAAAVGVSERDARRALPALVAAGLVMDVDAGYRLAKRTS
jgi:DNA processing protein